VPTYPTTRQQQCLQQDSNSAYNKTAAVPTYPTAIVATYTIIRQQQCLQQDSSGGYSKDYSGYRGYSRGGDSRTIGWGRTGGQNTKDYVYRTIFSFISDLLSVCRLQLRAHVVEALPPIFGGGTSATCGPLAPNQRICKALYNRQIVLNSLNRYRPTVEFLRTFCIG